MGRRSRLFLAATLALLWGLACSGPPPAAAPRPEAQLAIASVPEGATAIVAPEGAPPFVVTTPWEGSVPEGPTRLWVGAADRQPATRSLLAHGSVQHEEWLDPPQQILDLQRIIPTGHRPKSVLVTPDNRELWVALLGGPPSIRVHELPSGRTIEEITLGKAGAVELEISTDHSKIYASQMESAKVYEIDRATRTLERTFQTGSIWTKVLERSFDGTRIYASNWEGDDVSEIDLATGKLLRRLPTADTPRGLYATPDGRWLYVTGFGDGMLERIDLHNGARSRRYLGGALRHLVTDDSRHRMYISDMARSRVLVADLEAELAAEGSITELAAVCEKPNTIDLSPDGRVLFVSCRGRNGPSYMEDGPEWGAVLALDALTGEVLDAIVGGNQPTGLDLSDDGTLLVFSDFRDDTLRLYGVPPSEVLLSGGGGRRDLYAADLVKVKEGS